jgi:hypothetical protein
MHQFMLPSNPEAYTRTNPARLGEIVSRLAIVPRATTSARTVVVASAVIAVGFVWLLSLTPVPSRSQPFADFPVYRDPSQLAYAGPRRDVSSESPSVNPQGALVALTSSLVRGEMNDDEVVVVAEVFGNGLAKIDEVVEPSKNRRAVGELEKALKSDPDFAPFVPANLDQRPDSVRVVLKIQNVNVSTRIRPKHL